MAPKKKSASGDSNAAEASGSGKEKKGGTSIKVITKTLFMIREIFF
jgi:hypothetical protein